MQKPPHQYDPEYNRNLMVAFAIICVLMGLWYYFYEIPHRHVLLEQQQKIQAEEEVKQAKLEKTQTATVPQGKDLVAVPKPREEIITNAPRIKVNTPSLHGTINLKGLRIDDLTLAKYKEILDPKSPEAILLLPPGTDLPEFIETGWISGDKSITAPNSDTIWKVEGNSTLTASEPVTLSWDNGQGFKFITKISIDDKYMFMLEQSIENHSAAKASFFPYGLLSQSEPFDKKAAGRTRGGSQVTQRTGPLGVTDKTLHNISYKDMRDNDKQELPDSTGWIGITDQYWAKALIPQNGETYKANFRYTHEGADEKFQVDYLGNQKTVEPGTTITYSPKIFTGAKELKVLEAYRDKYQIPLFERIIDFGWFHFLAEPLMKVLLFFNDHINNIGLSILLLTLCVKLCLFPLARKSYISMGRMRDLQPKMKQLKEQYGKDKMEMNKKTMELYKKEKVNPASGCLPILLQIPIFFALIKVFNVSIEMRHTPFYGWIHDLSAPDPTSVFNLFGLIPLPLPAMLVIGAWPCIWAASMYIQQKLTPMTNMDPTQQKMMKLLPIFLVFAFSKVPAGLVIYYAFSNTLTIFQQLYFLKFHGQKTA